MTGQELYDSLWVDNGTHSVEAICARLDVALAAARRDERERCAAVIDEWVKHYGIEIFPEPSSGEHGNTIDACSARALRDVLPRIASKLRALDAET